MKTLKNLQDKTPEELISLVNSLVENYEQKLQQRDTFIDALQQELQLAKLRHYGRKSEKDLDGAIQSDLFDEAIAPNNSDEIETVEASITVSSHKRKKSGRKPLPKDLPRVQQIHDLADNEKVCCCGVELTQIGTETSEQLDIIPAKVQVIEHVRLKYACKACEETIATAAAPKLPIPKSIATPGTLAHVLVSKYKDHLPLYRQESIFQRMGVDIARNTLSNWVIKAADVVLPIYQRLQQNIIDYDIAYADETRVQVLKEPGRDATSHSYMWTVIGGPPDKRSIIYHYDPGRAHTVIEDILLDFKGYLHCDGFTGYDTYAADHDVQLIGCWMHGRRRFAEIVKMTKSKGLAHKAVALIAKLYKYEKHIKENNYSVEQTYQYRIEQSKPALDTFKQWLNDNYHKVSPKSPIGKAIKYCINQWPKLISYLEDGRLEIDNGLSERTIKPFVIGRKNWMFSTSIAGVKAGQIIYSIIETCAAHKIEPYAYFRYVLTTLPQMKHGDSAESLLPFNIDQELIKKY